MPDSQFQLAPPPFRSFASRIVSLDVLRGLAILLMILSGLLPKTLPNWLDHGYQPHYVPNEQGQWISRVDQLGTSQALLERWKAYTWVDLVLPMFLFAMGAAISMSMSSRLQHDVSRSALVRSVLSRWLVLIAFAVVVKNITPPFTPGGNHDTLHLLTIGGFGLAFLFFVRWPAIVPRNVQIGIRTLAGLALLARIIGYGVRRADLAELKGNTAEYFNWGRSDIIILVLAQTYLVAAMAWIFIPRRPILRLFVLLPFMLLAHYLAINYKTYPDWLWAGNWPSTFPIFGGDSLWRVANLAQSPKLLLNFPHWIKPLGDLGASRPWVEPAFNFAPLWDFTWYKYLFVIVPGTIVGDWISRWSRRTTIGADDLEAATRPRYTWQPLGIALLLAAAVFVGLRHYGHGIAGIGGPLRTPWLAPILALPVLFVFVRVTLPESQGDRWGERPILKLGVVFFLVGLLLACLPTKNGGFFEGGISKGPPSTLSYYTLSVGLCCLILTGLLRLYDTRRHAPALGVVEANGQNPLLAYFIAHSTFPAFFALSIFAFVGHPFGENVHSLDDLLGARMGEHPWVQALFAVFKTSLIALFVWLLTKARIFWRA